MSKHLAPALQARYDAALSLMNEGRLNEAEAEFKALVATPASEPLLSEAISPRPSLEYLKSMPCKLRRLPPPGMRRWSSRPSQALASGSWQAYS